MVVEVEPVTVSSSPFDPVANGLVVRWEQWSTALLTRAPHRLVDVRI